MHFSVLVITNEDETSLEEQMDRYDEEKNSDGEIYMTKEDLIYDQVLTIKSDLSQKARFDADPLAFFNKTGHYASIKEIPLELQERVRTQINERYEEAVKLMKLSPEELYQHYREEYDDDDCFDEEGNLLSFYNSEGRWDWWVVGGRWPNLLRKLDGTNCDSAYKDELNIEQLGKMSAEEEGRQRRFWKYYVEGDKSAALSEEEASSFVSIRSADAYKDMYRTEDNYINHINKFSVHALIDSDGEWHEGDDFDNSEDWERFIQETIDAAPANYRFTIVDCHE